MKKSLIVAFVALSFPFAVLAAEEVDFTPNPPPMNFDERTFDKSAPPSCSNGLACGGGGYAPRPVEWAGAIQTCNQSGFDCWLDLRPTEYWRKQMLDTARQQIELGNWRGFYSVAVGDTGQTFGYWHDKYAKGER